MVYNDIFLRSYKDHLFFCYFIEHDSLLSHDPYKKFTQSSGTYFALRDPLSKSSRRVGDKLFHMT